MNPGFAFERGETGQWVVSPSLVVNDCTSYEALEKKDDPFSKMMLAMCSKE